MADKYWWPSGGTGSSTGNWSSTTNWSTSSASYVSTTAPTTADNVNFGSYSGASAFTVTNSTTANCANLVINNANMTLAGSGTSFQINGSVTVTAFASRTFSGFITFGSTSSVVLNFGSMTFATTNFTFNGVGGTWTLGSALTAGAITLQNGTLDTSSSGNYSLTAQSIGLSTGTKALNLNASTVTLSGTSPVSFATSATGFTFNAGTSTINLSSTGPTFAGNSNTFYNVNCTSTGMVLCAITGANTFQSLTFAGKSNVGLIPITLAGTQTINGAFTVSAPTIAGGSRYFFSSTTLGTQRTVTAGSVSLTDVDFRDINNTGGAWTGTRLGDAGNNSGITFATPKTVYWNLGGSVPWSNTGWATTSTGTPAEANFPLPQDTAIFSNNLPTAGSTVTLSTNYNLPAIDFSARSNTLTFAIPGAPNLYGSITLSSAITLTGTGQLTFSLRSGTATITSAGRTWTQPFTFNNIGATVRFGDAFMSSSASGLTHGYGTLDAQTYNITCTTFNSSALNTRTLSLGTGTWTITGSGSTAWNTTTTQGLTVNAGTSTISMTSASAKTFAGSSLSGSARTYGVLNQGGSGALTLSGNSTFNNITNTVAPATVTFTAGTTNTFANFDLNGTAGNLVTINSSTAGTRANLVKTGSDVSCDYLNIQDIAAA